MEVTGGFEESSFKGVARVPVMEWGKRDRTSRYMQSFKNFAKKRRTEKRVLVKGKVGFKKLF